MVVYNSNPAAIAPDQNTVRKGLEREDLFTVVLEHISDRYGYFADIVLPSTTFLEHTDVYFATPLLSPAGQTALPAPREALPNTGRFRRLAALMGLQDPASATATMTDSPLLSGSHPFVGGSLSKNWKRNISSPSYLRPVPSLRWRRVRHPVGKV